MPIVDLISANIVVRGPFNDSEEYQYDLSKIALQFENYLDEMQRIFQRKYPHLIFEVEVT